jgi:transcriptional regulator with XRE-family HTH domain
MKDLLHRSRDRRAWRPAVARALRREARITLAEVADAIDVSEATISRWETGVRRPRGVHADRYVALLTRLEDDLRRG